MSKEIIDLVSEDRQERPEFQAEFTEKSFIHQLLQNANDAYTLVREYKGSYAVDFRIIKKNREVYLVFTHDGKPFDEKDVGVISDNVTVDNGKRKDGRLIGYHGIGFKSVFVVADYAYIQSGEYQFRLSKQKLPSTEWKKENFSKAPSPIDLSAFREKKVIIVLHLYPSKQLEVVKQLRALKSNPEHILFLNKVKQLNYYEENEIHTIKIEKKGEKFNIFDQEGLSARLISAAVDDEFFREWYVLDRNYQIPPQIEYDLIKRKTDSTISIAIPAKNRKKNRDKRGEDKETKKINSQRWYYCYLPIIDPVFLEIFSHVYVHADFSLDRTRQNFLKDIISMDWNKFLFEKIIYDQFYLLQFIASPVIERFSSEKEIWEKIWKQVLTLIILPKSIINSLKIANDHFTESYCKSIEEKFSDAIKNFKFIRSMDETDQSLYSIMDKKVDKYDFAYIINDIPLKREFINKEIMEYYTEKKFKELLKGQPQQKKHILDSAGVVGIVQKKFAEYKKDQIVDFFLDFAYFLFKGKFESPTRGRGGLSNTEKFVNKILEKINLSPFIITLPPKSGSVPCFSRSTAVPSDRKIDSSEQKLKELRSISGCYLPKIVLEENDDDEIIIQESSVSLVSLEDYKDHQGVSIDRWREFFAAIKVDVEQLTRYDYLIKLNQYESQVYTEVIFNEIQKIYKKIIELSADRNQVTVEEKTLLPKIKLFSEWGKAWLTANLRWIKGINLKLSGPQDWIIKQPNNIDPEHFTQLLRFLNVETIDETTLCDLEYEYDEKDHCLKNYRLYYLILLEAFNEGKNSDEKELKQYSRIFKDKLKQEKQLFVKSKEVIHIKYNQYQAKADYFIRQDEKNTTIFFQCGVNNFMDFCFQIARLAKEVYGLKTPELDLQKIFAWTGEQIETVFPFAIDQNKLNIVKSIFPEYISLNQPLIQTLSTDSLSIEEYECRPTNSETGKKGEKYIFTILKQQLIAEYNRNIIQKETTKPRYKASRSEIEIEVFKIETKDKTVELTWFNAIEESWNSYDMEIEISEKDGRLIRCTKIEVKSSILARNSMISYFTDKEWKEMVKEEKSEGGVVHQYNIYFVCDINTKPKYALREEKLKFNEIVRFGYQPKNENFYEIKPECLFEATDETKGTRDIITPTIFTESTTFDDEVKILSGKPQKTTLITELQITLPKEIIESKKRTRECIDLTQPSPKRTRSDDSPNQIHIDEFKQKLHEFSKIYRYKFILKRPASNKLMVQIDLPAETWRWTDTQKLKQNLDSAIDLFKEMIMKENISSQQFKIQMVWEMKSLSIAAEQPILDRIAGLLEKVVSNDVSVSQIRAALFYNRSNPSMVNDKKPMETATCILQ